MSHLDDEQIALHALGEPLDSAEDRRHLEECEECAAEVAEMAHVAVVGRSTLAAGALETPSSEVWARVHSELGLGPAVAADPLAPDEVRRSMETVDLGAETPAAAPRRPAPRRRLGRVWALAASAVVVASIGAGIWIATSASPPVVVVASAELDAFPGHPEAVGAAEVDDPGDGTRILTVTLEGDREPDGEYREVWLIRNDGESLVSLGVLDGSSGTFVVPDGVDLAEYSLVDISFEPTDGDPAHSGDSIVRGELDFL